MAGSPERSRFLHWAIIAALVAVAVLLAGHAVKRFGLGSIIPDTQTRQRLLELKKTSDLFADYEPVKSINHSSVVFDLTIGEGDRQKLPWASEIVKDPLGRYAFTWRIKVPFPARFSAGVENASGYSLTLVGRDGLRHYFKTDTGVVPSDSISINPGIYLLSVSSINPVDSLFVDVARDSSVETKSADLEEPFKVMKLAIEMDEFAERDFKRLIELAKNSSAASTVKMPSGRVEARLKDGDRTLDVNIALSGRTREHLDWAPSLDVAIKGGKAVAGLKSFKLYRPGTKSGLYDMVFLSMLRDMGLFVPREEAVVLFVNGIRQGVYILMETSDEPLFASQERGEGSILGLDTDKLFFDYPYGSELGADLFYKTGEPGEATLDTRFFLSKDFIDRMERRSTALYIAFASTYLSAHGLGVDDLRFYEDPATRLFTPIPRDLNPGLWSTSGKLRAGLTHMGWLSTPEPYTVWPVKRLLKPDYRHEKDGADFSDVGADGSATGVTDAHFALSRFMADSQNRSLVNGFLAYFRKNSAFKRQLEARLVSALSTVLAVAPYEKYLAEQLAETSANGVKFLDEWIDANLIATDSPMVAKDDGVSYIWNARNSTLPAKGLAPSLVTPVAYGMDKKDIAQKYLLAFKLDRRIFSILAGGIVGYPQKSFAEAPAFLPNATELSKAVETLVPVVQESAGASNETPEDMVMSLGTLFKDKDRALLLFLARNATKERTSYKLSLRGTLSSHEPVINRIITLGEGSVKRASIRDAMTNSFHAGEFLRLIVFDVPMGESAVFYTLSAPDGARLFFPPYMYIPAKSLAIAEPGNRPLPAGFIEEEGGFRVESGTAVKIDGHVTLPDSKGLTIGEGAIFEFSPKASLKVSGDLLINGTKERPVKFISARGSGDPGSAWGGLFVLGSRSKHAQVVLKNTVFDNMGEFPKSRVGEYALNGAISIYGADVEIEDSVIKNSRGEDALNLIASTARINGLEIIGAAADSLDMDFVSGSVAGFKSIESGGDGLDLSGSLVKCSGSSFVGNKDKGISIGEASRAHVSDSFFESNDMGIANKDQSDLVVSGSTFKSNNIAIAEFIKKTYFGKPSSSIGADNSYENNGKDYDWLGFFFY